MGLVFVAYVWLMFNDFHGIDVGKYTSPMDPPWVRENLPWTLHGDDSNNVSIDSPPFCEYRCLACAKTTFPDESSLLQLCGLCVPRIAERNKGCINNSPLSQQCLGFAMSLGSGNLGFWNKFVYFRLGSHFGSLQLTIGSPPCGRRKPTKSWWKMRSWRTPSRNDPMSCCKLAFLVVGWMNHEKVISSQNHQHIDL